MTRAKKNPAPPASGHGANTSEAQDTPVESLSQQAAITGAKPGTYAAVAKAAIFDHRLNSTAIRVFAALAAWADAYGECYPKIRVIAERIGCSRRTVETALAALEETGYIRRLSQRRLPGRGGGKANNRYFLHYPKTDAKNSSHRSEALPDTPSDTPSKGDTIPQALPAQCGGHRPIEQNQEDRSLKPTLNPPLKAAARRSTGEGTAEQAERCEEYRASQCEGSCASCNAQNSSHDKQPYLSTSVLPTLKPGGRENDQDDCLIPDRPAALPQAKAASKEELNDPRLPTADDPHQIVYRRLHKLTGQTGMAWGFLLDTPAEVHSSLVEYSNKRLVDAFSAWMRSPAAQAFDQGMEQCRLEAVNG